MAYDVWYADLVSSLFDVQVTCDKDDEVTYAI